MSTTNELTKVYKWSALTAAVEQYRLVMAERELLEGTLRGSLKMLSEVLSLLRPEVYGRAARIAPYVRPLAKLCGDPAPWQTEVAAMLCLMGYIVLPEGVVSKVERGRQLSADDAAVYRQHAEVAAKLVALGAKEQKTVTKDTKYLIVGENAGASTPGWTIADRRGAMPARATRSRVCALIGSSRSARRKRNRSAAPYSRPGWTISPP